MTPAINLLKKNTIIYKLHTFSHDSAEKAYGMEAVVHLSVAPERVFKTLVVELADKQLVVAVIPVSTSLSMKAIAKVCGAKKAGMASATRVERETGYVLGGVSPLAQKKRLKTCLDRSAQNFHTIFVSGGRRGLEIELNPDDLLRLVAGSYADIGR